MFRNVVVSALRGRVTSHTLMTVGVVAAAAVGEWAAAGGVVFFMRVGEFVERYTAERAQDALAHLVPLSPQTAWVEHGGAELVVPADQVRPREVVVVVRPGEVVSVDGQVVEGAATVDQAAITGRAFARGGAAGLHGFRGVRGACRLPAGARHRRGLRQHLRSHPARDTGGGGEPQDVPAGRGPVLGLLPARGGRRGGPYLPPAG
ncbi:MAG: hypothetical protein C4304_02905 [candidate division GAL15 bacterium]